MATAPWRIWSTQSHLTKPQNPLPAWDAASFKIPWEKNVPRGPSSFTPHPFPTHTRPPLPSISITHPGGAAVNVEGQSRSRHSLGGKTDHPGARVPSRPLFTSCYYFCASTKRPCFWHCGLFQGQHPIYISPPSRRAATFGDMHCRSRDHHNPKHSLDSGQQRSTAVNSGQQRNGYNLRV